MKYVVLIIMLCAGSLAIGQNDCRVLVVNRAEGLALSFSTCLVGDLRIAVQTDSAGYLTFPEQTKFPVQVEIFTLTCKQTITVSSCDETVSVHCPDIVLPTAHIQYLDANDIVRKAAAEIKHNYPDTGYALHGLFRTYKKINHQFDELAEAQLVVGMRIDTTKNIPEASEVFGAHKLRKTPYTITLSNYYDWQVSDLFNQNPVYHADLFPIAPLYIDRCTYILDSAKCTDSTWLVVYAMHSVSGENHGISNFIPESFAGEADETGYFIIRKDNFAIIKFVRESVRDKRYGYPGYNNFLHPDLIYTGEFIEGYLEVIYTLFDDKYIPARIFHAYTNTYTHVATNTQTYHITDYNEWFCDSVSTTLSDADYQAMLDFKPDLSMPYTYQPEDWKNLHPPVFISAETLQQGLTRVAPLETLFIRGGN